MLTKHLKVNHSSYGIRFGYGGPLGCHHCATAEPQDGFALTFHLQLGCSLWCPFLESGFCSREELASQHLLQGLPSLP